MDTIQFPWVVGLFEGEGTCYLGRNTQGKDGQKKNIHTPYVTVQMTDREPLDRAQAITGFGHVGGPYPPKGKYSIKEYYIWRFTAQQDVLDFFEAAWPMLSQRRKDQAQPVVDKCRERLALRASRGRYAKPLGFTSIPK